MKFKLVIAYDGANYEGWQTQKTGTGVQQVIEGALAKLFRSKPGLHGSSRTDTGVHALGMAAHFEVQADEFKMPVRKLALALNAWLPEDIRVLSATHAPDHFHARFGAVGKQYRYFIWNHTAMNPLLRRTAWHVPVKLDVKRMRVAAKLFIGRHDFQSFAANPGYKKKSTVRTVSRCEIKKSGAQMTVIIESDGFLYKMCRGIAGTIVQAGLGKFPPKQVKTMLAQKDPSRCGHDGPRAWIGALESFLFGKMNIVLVEPEIPPNTGNVARLCAATKSVLHLVEPFGFKLDDAQLKRAGMDYWQHVEWHRWPDWKTFETHLPTDARLWFIESGGPGIYSEAKFLKNDYLVFGRETAGLPGALLEKNREHWLKIPMFNPKSRSLNLSNCVALVLFEALRQQGFGDEIG